MVVTKVFREKRISKIWSQFNVSPTGCWEWQGGKINSGYGRVRFMGSTYVTHRWSYEITYGPIPDGLLVCHKCDNPLCGNPEHLFLGTQQDNITDMWGKGRRKPLIVRTRAKPVSKYCKHGHLRTPKSTLINVKGQVVCRICSNNQTKARLAKKRIQKGTQ